MLYFQGKTATYLRCCEKCYISNVAYVLLSSAVNDGTTNERQTLVGCCDSFCCRIRYWRSW